MATDTMSTSPIGYYVHHHGTGHMQRAISICEHVSRPIIMFSSQPAPPYVPHNVTFIELTTDMIDGYVQPEDSLFHYTPNDPAVFERNQQLIDAWQKFKVKSIYVDVSMEVVVLAKLYGLTVGHALMKGVRTDKAHTYGYGAADYLLAHYSPSFDAPEDHHTDTPVRYSGGISRFKKQLPQPLTDAGMSHGGYMPHTVVVTCSPKSEYDMTADVVQHAMRFPMTTWHLVGRSLEGNAPNIISHGVVDDPQSVYEQADVIIGSGGMNTIMEVASLGKPFICIPEARPFGEQVSAAKKLHELRAAVYLPTYPDPGDWTHLSVRLQNLNLKVITDLVDDKAAERAAEIIESAG